MFIKKFAMLTVLLTTTPGLVYSLGMKAARFLHRTSSLGRIHIPAIAFGSLSGYTLYEIRQHYQLRTSQASPSQKPSVGDFLLSETADAWCRDQLASVHGAEETPLSKQSNNALGVQKEPSNKRSPIESIKFMVTYTPTASEAQACPTTGTIALNSDVAGALNEQLDGTPPKWRTQNEAAAATIPALPHILLHEFHHVQERCTPLSKFMFSQIPPLLCNIASFGISCASQPTTPRTPSTIPRLLASASRNIFVSATLATSMLIPHIWQLRAYETAADNFASRTIKNPEQLRAAANWYRSQRHTSSSRIIRRMSHFFADPTHPDLEDRADRIEAHLASRINHSSSN